MVWQSEKAGKSSGMPVRIAGIRLFIRGLRMNNTLVIHGYLSNTRVKIKITDPINGDYKYAKNFIDRWNLSVGAPLKGNMEIIPDTINWGKRHNSVFK